MNSIKNALGLGHSHSSHKNSSATEAANCPECLAAQQGTGTTSSTYSTGSNMNTGSTLNSSTNTMQGSSYGTTGTDNAITRSEEQLLVGKQAVPTGEAALKKTIHTEHVSTNVPLVQEKVVVSREPITQANRGAALSGPELKESEHVVTTSAERPIVQKEVVPKERVHLGKVAEVTNQAVGGEIRKEHITLEQGGAPMAGTTGVSAGTTMHTNDPLYNKDSTYSSTTNTTRKTAY